MLILFLSLAFPSPTEMVLSTPPNVSNGTFLVRAHKEKDQYVMCVVFREQPTHHLIKKKEDGTILINNTPYDECRNLSEVRTISARLVFSVTFCYFC